MDSESEGQTNIREMEFVVDNNDDKITSKVKNGLFMRVKGEFLPQTKKKNTMFYGSQHIYHLFRFYFTLYERFLKAFEISHEFEPNSKTIHLSKEVKKNNNIINITCIKGKRKNFRGKIRII